MSLVPWMSSRDSICAQLTLNGPHGDLGGNAVQTVGLLLKPGLGIASRASLEGPNVPWICNRTQGTAVDKHAPGIAKLTPGSPGVAVARTAFRKETLSQEKLERETLWKKDPRGE